MTTSGDDAPQMDCEMELGVDDALTEDQAIDDFLKQHAPQMECEMGLGVDDALTGEQAIDDFLKQHCPRVRDTQTHPQVARKASRSEGFSKLFGGV